MGWFYTHDASRSDIISELTNPKGELGHKCLAKFTSGNTLWTVEEYTPTGEATKRFIGCYLLQKDKCGWGYKPMDESMGPYYYSCPPKYLAMVPVADAEWRLKVVEYWRRRKLRRLVK